MNTHALLFKDDLNVLSIYLNNNTYVINDEADIILLSQIFLADDKTDYTAECNYFICKYQKLLLTIFHNSSQESIQCFRHDLLTTELRVKRFYDYLSKIAKNKGYLVTKSQAVFDSSLYNCKSILDLTMDLTAENKSGRDTRVISTLAILPAVGFALPNIKDELFPHLKYGHTLLTSLFMLLILFIVAGTEYYRTKKIKNLAKILQGLMVTREGHAFSFYDLNLTINHFFCLKTALMNILSEQPCDKFKIHQKDTLLME